MIFCSLLYLISSIVIFTFPLGSGKQELVGLSRVVQVPFAILSLVMSGLFCGAAIHINMKKNGR